jgi:hypothetical protein
LVVFKLFIITLTHDSNSLLLSWSLPLHPETGTDSSVSNLLVTQPSSPTQQPTDLGVSASDCCVNNS